MIWKALLCVSQRTSRRRSVNRMLRRDDVHGGDQVASAGLGRRVC